MRTEARPWIKAHLFGTLLFDLQTDPGREYPLDDPEIEARTVQSLVELMLANDAPKEPFERLGLLEELSE